VRWGGKGTRRFRSKGTHLLIYFFLLLNACAFFFLSFPRLPCLVSLHGDVGLRVGGEREGWHSEIHAIAAKAEFEGRMLVVFFFLKNERGGFILLFFLVQDP
jgi:hypothetical protein